MTNKVKDLNPTLNDRESQKFLDLAYRLVRCTEPEEQHRLKDEVVKDVLKRRRGRKPARGTEVQQ